MTVPLRLNTGRSLEAQTCDRRMLHLRNQGVVIWNRCTRNNGCAVLGQHVLHRALDLQRPVLSRDRIQLRRSQQPINRRQANRCPGRRVGF